MKEIALHDAKNRLSALINEMEASGEEIVITRHGRPAARLAPVVVPDDPERRAALGALLVREMKERAEHHPSEKDAIAWDELKADSDADRC